jgi:prolipoprotein diacylglyceryltransferase
MLAGTERFLVEILRAKDDRFIGPFTIAQVTSLALVAVGAVLTSRWSRADAVAMPDDAAILKRAG